MHWGPNMLGLTNCSCAQTVKVKWNQNLCWHAVPQPSYHQRAPRHSYHWRYQTSKGAKSLVRLILIKGTTRSHSTLIWHPVGDPESHSYYVESENTFHLLQGSCTESSDFVWDRVCYSKGSNASSCRVCCQIRLLAQSPSWCIINPTVTLWASERAVNMYRHCAVEIWSPCGTFYAPRTNCWNWIELKTLFIHGILSLQSGILKSRALYNILIRSTNYALI